MSERPNLNLVQLDLDRSPGLSSSFVVPAKPGINLIYGLNEAGKSSVARAVSLLLWPNQEASKPFDARGVFEDSRGPLHAHRQDDDDVSWFRDGISAPAPDLPGDHLAACYQLGLLDLNRTGASDLDEDLAAEIRQQMAGGFDLAAVADMFPVPGNRRLSARSSWDVARSELLLCEARHRELSEQERGLTNLVSQQEQARQSVARGENIQAAIDKLKLVARQDALLSSLAALPADMKLFRQGDLELWRDLAEQIETRTEHIAGLEDEISQRAGRLSTWDAAANLSELVLLVQRVRDWSKETEASAQALAEAAARNEAARKDLAPELLAADIPIASEAAFQKLAEVHRQMLVQQARLDQWDHLLGLPIWREAKGDDSSSAAKVMSLVAGALETVCALGLLLWPGSGVSSPVSRGLLILLAADGLYRVVRYFGRSPGGVSDQMRNEMVHQHTQAATALGEAETARRELLRTQGQKEHRHDLGLLQELDRVARARTAAEDRDGFSGRHQHNETVLLEAVAAANAALVAAGAPLGADNPTGVQASFDQLSQQRAKADGLQEAQDSDEAALAKATRERTRAIDKQDQLRERLDLPQQEVDHEALLVAREAARPHFQEWSRELETVGHEIKALQERLNDQNTDLTAEELTTQLSAAQQQAATHTDLTTEIAGIRERIRQARKGNELAKARALEAETATDLNDQLEARRQAALGRLFFDTTISRHTSDRLPPLLAAMNALLNTFTGGLYELRVTETGFVALDNRGGQRALSELSDGTRAQLLLAARLGFIQQAEQGVQAPLFLDEAFTASDPERFDAIAGAMGRLAASTGRQIFYLTSNPSDLEAWQRALKKIDLPAAHVIDLGVQQGQTAVLARQEIAPLPSALIPTPDHDSAEAYAVKLKVPPLDPWAGENELPVFYLSTSDLALVQRLHIGGTRTLGQWRKMGSALVRAGQVSAAEAAQMAVRGKIWHHVLQIWQIGRGAPITRQSLVDSQALSESMMPPALALLAQTRGEAEAFMAGVHEGRIKRLNAAKKQALQEHLERSGHWDPREVWPSERVVAQVMGALADELKSGLITAGDLRELVLSLHGLACAVTVRAGGSHRTG